MLKKFADATPMKRGITADEVGNVNARSCYQTGRAR